MEEALHHCVFKEEINLVYNTFACFHVLRPDLWTAGEKPPGTVSSFICLSLFTSDSDLADQNQRVVMKAMRMKTHLVLQNKLSPKVKGEFMYMSIYLCTSVEQNGFHDRFAQHVRVIWLPMMSLMLYSSYKLLSLSLFLSFFLLFIHEIFTYKYI